MTYSTKKPHEFTSLTTPTGNEILPVETAAGEGASLKLSDVKKFINPTSTWKRPQFQNGWANFGNGFAELGYCLKDGMVHISGAIAGGAVSTVVFNLPTEYRPEAIFQAEMDGRNTANQVMFAQIIIAPNGDIAFSEFLSGTPAYINVNLSFPVARNFG